MAWALIIYLLGCYASLAFLLFVGEADGKAGTRVRQLLAASSLWRKTLFVIALTLVFLLLAPLIPLFFLHCIWVANRDAKFWKGFRRQHRDVIMDPISFESMNAVGRAFVLQHERAIDALSFRVHDNYLYKPEPLLIESRYYLSEDGRTILSIGHIDGQEYYSLTSFLSGGAGIETSVSRHPFDPSDINATRNYYAQFFDLESGAEIAPVYSAHQAMLDELDRETGQRIVAMRHDQLVPAVRYANRRFAATKQLLGELDQTPPLAEWPFEDQDDEVLVV